MLPPEGLRRFDARETGDRIGDDGRGRRRLLAAGAAAIAAPLLTARLARAAPPTTLRVGAVLPLTGMGARYGEAMHRAMIAAAAEVNAAAGAFALELVVDDSATDAAAAARAARRLIDSRGVDAIVGGWSAIETLAMMPVVLEARRILMSSAREPSIASGDDRDLVWRLQASDASLGGAFAEVCARRGFERPAIMAVDTGTGRAIAEGFSAAWMSRRGEPAAQVVYAPRRRSYRAELQRAFDARPDVVVLASYLPDATVVLREARDTDSAVRWLLPGWVANEELVAALGKEACEGLLGVEAVANEKSPSFARFDAAYLRAGGERGPALFHAAMAWDMIVVLALARHAAGPRASAAEINARIREVCNAPGEPVFGFEQGRRRLAEQAKIDYDGASSRLEFDRFGDARPDLAVYRITDALPVRTELIRG